MRCAVLVALAGLLVACSAFRPTPTQTEPSKSAGAPPSEQHPCGFQFGFAKMKAAIPEIVGDCAGHERVDVTSGDTTQRTTRGLLVWRKADGAVAFTDGAHTWLLGPKGLQQRGNDERLDWEKVPLPPTAIAVAVQATVVVAAAAPKQAPATVASLPTPVVAKAPAALAAPPTQAAKPRAPPTQAATGSSGLASAQGQPKLEIPTYGYYKSNSDVYVVGMVRNVGNGEAAAIEIEASLVDSANAVTGASRAIYGPSLLRPGKQAPWKALISHPMPFTAARANAQGQAPDRFSLGSDFFHQEFAFEGVTTSPVTGAYGWPKLSGRIKNTGSMSVKNTSIVAGVFDAGGKLRDVAGTIPGLADLAPGQASTFQIEFIGAPGDFKAITRYELYAEGLRG